MITIIIKMLVILQVIREYSLLLTCDNFSVPVSVILPSTKILVMPICR